MYTVAFLVLEVKWRHELQAVFGNARESLAPPFHKAVRRGWVEL